MKYVLLICCLTFYTTPAIAEPPSLEERVEALEKKVEKLDTTKNTLSDQSQDYPALTNSSLDPELTAFLSSAKAVPYYKEGTLVGLRFFALKSGSYWEKAGFKNGDIIKEVDGKNVANINHLMEALVWVYKNKTVAHIFKVERSNIEINLTYKEK